MKQVIEKELSLPRVSVLLANIEWATVQEFTPLVSGYYVCQRLSDDHPALTFDNLPVRSAFPRARSVGLLPPGFSVRTHPVATRFRAVNCVFDSALFEETTELDPDKWSEGTSAFMTIKSETIEAMMQRIYRELIQPGFGSELMIEAASTMILVEMSRYARKQVTRSVARGRPARGGLAPWQLRRIRDRVAAAPELGYPSLGELSELCGISQSHLMRTFKVSTGTQIHRYIAEERLKLAKRMLVEEQVSAREVSERLGFCSPAYFTSAFRRMTGLTPSDFRRRARLEEAGGI